MESYSYFFAFAHCILPSERFVIWGRKKESLMQWQGNCFRALD